jgi:predicted RNA methylase
MKTGIDIDMDALNIATENAQNVEAEIEFVHIDVLQFEKNLKKFKREKKIFDTVLMVKKI